jgi:DNA-binding LytR/AlgR family response regulator
LKTKCIIIDDEPIAIDVIKSHLQHFKDIEIVGECENAIEALEIINKQLIDLVFIDIEMPEVNGIDFLKNIDRDFKAIVTTAYRDYAIDGYQLDVVDYLLKPISLERFMKAIDKYFKQSVPNAIEIRKESGLDPDVFIYAKEGKVTHKIYLKDIHYIESLREFLKIHLVDRTIEIRYKISEFEEKLPSDFFIRIHKSFIISVGKIQSFNSHMIRIGNTELPVGRSYMAAVKKILEIE